MNFKMADISDRAEIERYMNKTSKPSLEYSFTTLYIWQEQYGMEFCIEDDFLYIRTGRKSKKYLFPMGAGDERSAIEKLVIDGAEFYSLSEEQMNKLNMWYPDKYEFSENRDMGDYIYKSNELAYLKGKKLSSKRNHINRFIGDNPDWSYEPITIMNIDEVKAMHKKWCELAEDEEGLAEEAVAVVKALGNFCELGLIGGLIRAGGNVVAFSVGEKLSESMFLVHIEKAFSHYSGAYQIINREFIVNNCMDFEFVNREEDTGNAGLRKAKLSYRPYYIVKKYVARIKE